MTDGTAATDVPDDRPTDPRAGGMTLVQVGDLAKRAGNEAFFCRGEVAELRREVRLALTPIRRDWYERVSAPVAALALVGLVAIGAVVIARMPPPPPPPSTFAASAR